MCICVRTGNALGDEGAKAVGEALKLNSTITALIIYCMKHLNIYRLIQLFIIWGCVYVYVQRMVLAMKELRDWEKH
jgi:hypothetical protein